MCCFLGLRFFLERAGNRRVLLLFALLFSYIEYVGSLHRVGRWSCNSHVSRSRRLRRTIGHPLLARRRSKRRSNETGLQAGVVLALLQLRRGKSCVRAPAISALMRTSPSSVTINFAPCPRVKLRTGLLAHSFFVVALLPSPVLEADRSKVAGSRYCAGDRGAW